MSTEDQQTDMKSLRIVTGKSADWDELAKDCVCFANARGGRIIIGIEDGEVQPPPGQTIPSGLAEKIVKRTLEALSEDGIISFTGEKRWRRYSVIEG